jgi:hypothetical protein
VSSGQLRPLLLQLERQSGSLRGQIEAALAAEGRPLRWAITAVQQRPDQPPLLQIEAVVLSGGGSGRDALG